MRQEKASLSMQERLHRGSRVGLASKRSSLNLSSATFKVHVLSLPWPKSPPPIEGVTQPVTADRRGCVDEVLRSMSRPRRALANTVPDAQWVTSLSPPGQREKAAGQALASSLGPHFMSSSTI